MKIEIEANDTYTVFTEKGDECFLPPTPQLNPIEAIQTEMYRITRNPFEEPEEFNNQFPF